MNYFRGKILYLFLFCGGRVIVVEAGRISAPEALCQLWSPATFPFPLMKAQLLPDLREHTISMCMRIKQKSNNNISRGMRVELKKRALFSAAFLKAPGPRVRKGSNESTAQIIDTVRKGWFGCLKVKGFPYYNCLSLHYTRRRPFSPPPPRPEGADLTKWILRYRVHLKLPPTLFMALSRVSLSKNAAVLQLFQQLSDPGVITLLKI